MISTHRKTSDISIIIPTLNEEENILLLKENLNNCRCEKIIVDGGSSDNTVTVAKESGFKVLAETSGRAAQLNLGAREAKGAILLFLHADTRLPHTFAPAVLEASEGGDFIAGAFRLAIENPTPSLAFIAACANLRSRIFRLPYGDQAIFVKKEDFFSLHMFPDLPIMEDYVFIKNARRKGRITLLPHRVTTSARRWRRLGVLRTTVINQLVIAGFYCGISPRRLALLYRG